LEKSIRMSSSYVLMVERGDDASLAGNEKIQKPSVDALAKLAVGLDVPFEWLAFGTGPEPEWDAPPRAESSTDLKAVDAPLATGTDDASGDEG